MKIKKFTTLNEGLEESYYLLTKHQRSDGEQYFHLFDDYEILFDYVVSEIYYQLKNYPKALDDFDKQDFEGDVDALFEYYNDIADNYKPNFLSLDYLSYEDINIEKEVKYEDWIKVRMNAKKYNI